MVLTWKHNINHQVKLYYSKPVGKLILFQSTFKIFQEIMSMCTRTNQIAEDMQIVLFSVQCHSDLCHFQGMILKNISMVKSSSLHVN